MLVTDNPTLALDAVGPSTPTVQHMFGFRSDVLLETPEGVSAVGQKDDLLMRLHALLAKGVDETGAWPGIHRLDEGETASGGIRLPVITMKRDQALAGDRLEPALLPAADIAAIHADIQRSIRRHVIRPGLFAGCLFVDRYALRC